MKRSLLCVLELFLLSTLFNVNAEEHDKAVVIANNRIIPTGGSVTLTCDVKKSTSLKFEWFRETSSEKPSALSNVSERVISVLKGGNYTCKPAGENVIITESDSVTIQETVRNRTTVKLQHSWSQIFTGETITLRCEIQGGEGKVWKYEWTAPNTNSPPTSSEYRISRVSVSHSGDYRCRGSSDYLLTGWSDAFTLTVSSSKPRATLTAQSSVIPAGGSVTLSCSVEGSAGWKFDWFRRDSQFSGAQKIGAGTSEHTISISEGGIYYCRGGRGDPVFSTEDSAPVTIQKQVLAAVKLQHSWSQIFTNETITLRCEIQRGEGKVWKYEWTAPNTNSPPTSSEYRISRVSVSHSGDYRCRGSSDYLLTGWSDAFRLTVS